MEGLICEKYENVSESLILVPEVASQVYKSRTRATEMGFLDRR